MQASAYLKLRLREGQPPALELIPTGDTPATKGDRLTLLPALFSDGAVLGDDDENGAVESVLG